VARALILTYHAVEAGRSPLCIDPALFEAHADVIAVSGARSLTIRELADALRAGALDGNTVAITFDDGFASVTESAMPVMEERGLTGTVFCVAGHLGGRSDWPSARADTYRSRLADAHTLRQLAEAGFEIGSHGMEHAPLTHASALVLERELADSRRVLEATVGAEVASYAYPYGAMPDAPGRMLVAATYDAACTTLFGRVSDGSDPHALPRIDAHYLRRPELLRRALEGRLGGYFRARSLASRARRTLIKDYAHPSVATTSLSE